MFAQGRGRRGNQENQAERVVNASEAGGREAARGAGGAGIGFAWLERKV